MMTKFMQGPGHNQVKLVFQVKISDCFPSTPAMDASINGNGGASNSSSSAQLACNANDGSSGSPTRSGSSSSVVSEDGSYRLYEAMFRVVKDSENVDERQHCFLIQTANQESR